MSAWQAAILGILQGLSEFLPISSSGHLLIGERLMGIDSTGALLEILLHLGTLVAVLIVFWGDFLSMILHPIKDSRLRMLVIATIPAVAVTLLFNDQIDELFTGWFLGPSFIITAVLLFVGEALKARRRKSTETVKFGHAATMGLMQAFAILPGVSRSGSTIVGGVSTGLTRESAARFSFMMSAVAIVGAVVFKLRDFLGEGGAVLTADWMVPLAGVLAAMVTGYLAIRFMLRLLKNGTLKPFAWYVLVIGLVVLVDQMFIGRFFPVAK